MKQLEAMKKTLSQLEAIPHKTYIDLIRISVLKNQIMELETSLNG